MSEERLYIGSRALRPDGYKTVDIDPAHEPDYLADFCDLGLLSDGQCAEIIASHVLEHVAWPRGFQALAEMARVLRVGGTVKIAVPDLTALAAMLLRGESPFGVVSLLYGGGADASPFETHRFGYTAPMLLDILAVLGFGDFSWWNSARPEAANGWMPGQQGSRVGISLNIAATKIGAPFVSPRAVLARLHAEPQTDFLAAVQAQATEECPAGVGGAHAAYLYQRLHCDLIEARQRIAYLEAQAAGPTAPTPHRGWRRLWVAAKIPPARGAGRDVPSSRQDLDECP